MDQEWFNQYWWLVAIGIAWELFWKGWALWKSARVGDKVWFIILLLVNTAGILPIAYIFIFSKHSNKEES